MSEKVFLVEWKLPECNSIIENVGNRDEASIFIEKKKSIGSEILNIWCGQKWHLRSDGKIYMLSENNLKVR